MSITSRRVRSPEEELLLACARPRLDTPSVDRVKERTTRDIRWEHLSHLALAHGVSPLLYRSLNTAVPDRVPSADLERMRRTFHAVARRNLRLAHELLRLLDHFNRRGIAAIPFKGPTFAVGAYGNLSLRQFDDLDILIPAGHGLEPRDILTDAGYEPEYRISDAAFRNMRFAIPFTRRNGEVTVDLHWGFELYRGVIPRLFLREDYERLWKRLGTVSLLGREICTLAPEDALLVAAVHGTKHTWDSLRQVCDVAEIVRSNQALHWTAIMQRARRLRARRLLLVALALAQALLDAPIPLEIRRLLGEDSHVQGLAGEAIEKLFSRDRRTSATLPIVEPFHLAVMDTPWDRCRYCFHILTAPTVEDFELVRLPDVLYPMYSAVRPLRLAGKYSVRVVQRLR